MSTTRRPKWQPVPPPTPRILHLPRRPRRKPPKNVVVKPLSIKDDHCRGKLESLFDQERIFSRCERRRERVEDEYCDDGGLVEEKWRFQAEILRAECKFLRMEREIAVKKLQRTRVHTERTLRSALQTLISGRAKICEGKSVSVVLEEEIEDLAGKLEELQRSSGVRDFEVGSCSNFDKQASLLQRRLEKLGRISDDKCVKEIREMAEASLSINASCLIDESFISNRKCTNKFTDVEILRRKMEGLSKGMLLERMKEEYGSMLSTTNSSVASSASTSKRIEFSDSSSSSIQQLYQKTMSHEENVCSGRCKAIVRRIVEQVRAETEQWSQMQEMLGQVREEMEEVQASRDFWEDRALDSDYQIQSLQTSVQDWRHKALSSETKANELQAQISMLREELEKLRMEQNTEVMRSKGLPPIPRDKQNEKEKRVLICRLKENHHTSDNGSKQKEVFSDGRRRAHTCGSGLVAPRRSPFRDIGNLSPLARQNSKAIFPLHCPEPSITDESF